MECFRCGAELLVTDEKVRVPDYDVMSHIEGDVYAHAACNNPERG